MLIYMTMSKSSIKDQLYSWDDSRIAGTQLLNEAEKVEFKRVFSIKQRVLLGILGALLSAINIGFIMWLLNPAHVAAGQAAWITALAAFCFAAIVIIELVRIIQGATLWLFAAKAVDPIPYTPPKNMRIAVLTTIVPSKEPIDLVRKTLAAMKQIKHDGVVDVWILDEGDDQQVKQMACDLGVYYFTRKGKEKYNQPSGEFKAKSKAGNHNSWRDTYEHIYDVVAQMDPDHLPLDNFLERTLGYFRDPNVGFVVAPQVYGNQDHRWLTRASASQAYIFHGIIQRGGNGFGSPLLIGTNHLYRPKAWKQIGGYQDSIIEDHLTSMKLHGTVNPETGKPWQSVYTPDIISVGEGPTSWTDYFNQQKRWAYGIWEILLKHAYGLHKNLKPGQKLSYAALQFFYPSVAVVWVLGNIIAAIYFGLGVATLNVDVLLWTLLWGLSLVAQIALFSWLNRFNLTGHERKHGGKDAMLLTLLTAPVYTAAALAALAKRPLVYAVTAKGSLSSPDSLKTYRSHLTWAFITLTMITVGYFNVQTLNTQLFWALFMFAVASVPLLAHVWLDKIVGAIKRARKAKYQINLPDYQPVVIEPSN